MAINKIQIEKLRHNKVDQYAHSLIREIAFIDYEIGMHSIDKSISEEKLLENIEFHKEEMFYALEYLAFYLGYKVEERADNKLQAIIKMEEINNEKI